MSNNGCNTLKKIYRKLYFEARAQLSQLKNEKDFGEIDSDEKLLIKAAYSLTIKLFYIYFFALEKIHENESDLLSWLDEKRLSHLYSEARKVYPYIFEEQLFNWFKPSNNLIINCLSLLIEVRLDDFSVDVFGGLYESILSKYDRKSIGLFYTPHIIVEYILENIDYTENEEIIGKTVIDPSCGSGGFLAEVAQRLIRKCTRLNLSSSEIIETVVSSIFGLDIDPFACFIAETNILLQLLPFIKDLLKEKRGRFLIPKINIYQTNSIQKNNLKEMGTIQYNIKNRIENFKDGFDYVIGNPPYIESKRMDSHTKKLCKMNFPSVAKGGFDIYICFIKLGIDLLKKNGKFGYIIPNKFMAAKYATSLRKLLLSKYTIKQIVDVSYLPVFKDAMVYPIILILQKKEQLEDEKIILIPEIKNLSRLNSTNKIFIPKSLYNLTQDNIFFFLPRDIDERNVLYTIINKSSYKLGELIEIRWSISFHRKGLRQKFIFKNPIGKNPQKILGGKSFGGNSEVQRYSLNWAGYWIDYNEEKAKQMKNPFPNLSLFKGKKIIICQYSKRMRCTIDNENYVCKDIFFVAKLKEKAKIFGISEELIVSFLNSKLFSYFYSNIFAGAHVGGRYLHYLPTYLNSIPFPKIDPSIKNLIENKVGQILAGNVSTSEFFKLDNELDYLFFKIYNLTDIQIKKILKNVEKLELKNSKR